MRLQARPGDADAGAEGHRDPQQDQDGRTDAGPAAGERELGEN